MNMPNRWKCLMFFTQTMPRQSAFGKFSTKIHLWKANDDSRCEKFRYHNYKIVDSKLNRSMWWTDDNIAMIQCPFQMQTWRLLNRWYVLIWLGSFAKLLCVCQVLDDDGRLKTDYSNWDDYEWMFVIGCDGYKSSSKWIYSSRQDTSRLTEIPNNNGLSVSVK